MVEFSIQLKSVTKKEREDGNVKDGLAIVVAYGKEFTLHRFVYSSGIKVPRKGFNAAKPGRQLKALLDTAEKAYQSLIDEHAAMNSASLKARIQLLSNRLQWHADELHVMNGSAIEKYSLNEGVDKKLLDQQVKEELSKAKPNVDKIVKRVLSEGGSELFGFWQGIIDGDVKPRAGKGLRKATLTDKRQTMLLVKEFNPQASFELMDMRFYNGFTTWLSKQTVKKTNADGSTELVKRFDSNTIGKHIKQLKAILHLAYRNELINNDRFRYWSVIKETNEVITLSKEEILTLNKLELSGTKDDVRDLFMLAIFLGPRISDFKSFRKESLQVQAGVTYFSYVQEKTGALVKIPCHPIVLGILEKRNGEFPRMIAEQNIRAYLKEICKAAGFNDLVITKIRDGKAEYKQKWKALSPHSARRSFASSLFYGWFSRPVPASLCMRFTGHKSEKSFMVYIGASEQALNEASLSYFDLTPTMKSVMKKKRTKKEQELEEGLKAHQKRKAQLNAESVLQKKFFPDGVLQRVPGSQPEPLSGFDMKQAELDLANAGWDNAAQQLQDIADEKEKQRPQKQLAGKESGKSRKPPYKEMLIAYKEQYLKSHKKLDNHIPDSRIIQQFKKDHPDCPSEKTLYRYLS